MRLNKLEDAVGRADARFFLNEGFISLDTYNRVLKWLKGQEDEEIQRIVIGWMKRDAAWLDDVTPAMVSHFWYAALPIRILLGCIRRMLLSRIRELAEPEQTGQY